MKTITYVMPGGSGRPVGGYKTVYEYANRLVADGHSVNIVYPATILWHERSLGYKLRGIVRYLLYPLTRSHYLPYGWFPLDARVRLHLVKSLNERHIPDGDIVVATSCETSEYVATYSSRKGEKYYFLQHFEDWSFPKERLIRTWKFDMRRIVVARWLQDIAESLGLSSTLIHYGLDFQAFGTDQPIEQRNPNSIIMLYHDTEWKGSRVGLEALERVAASNIPVEVTLFSTCDPPSDLPEYVTFYKKPEQRLLRDLYNKSAIYVGTSYGEGWGLTVPESMLCGCAVACTDVHGYNEMVFQNETGLLSPAGDADQLAANILALVEDQELRQKLAQAGHEFVQRFTWEDAYERLKNAFELEKT